MGGSIFSTNLLLVFLIVLDIVLFIVAFFFPATWFQVIHGTPYIDPQALLQRMGAGWAAFSLFQIIALIKWPKQPYWLVLVAGIRLTEIFTDWTYLYFAQSITGFGKIALFISPPANVLFGWIFIRRFLRCKKDSKGQAVS